MVEPALPAWSEPFIAGHRGALERLAPLERIDREWAWGGADGTGVTVAIIDSGVEGSHPAVGGRLVASFRVSAPPNRDEPAAVEEGEAIDVVGHGTACAGIIHELAPAADLVSIRVLGPDSRGRGEVFAAGLAFAIERRYPIVNMSLSSKSEALFATFHDLADRAYFAGMVLVSAANNVPGPSYPSLFSAVVSVAAHDVAEPWTFFHNPSPPVEFGAYGLDVPLAWKDGARITASGNSFAAPHIAAIAALIRSKHPSIRPFELKAVLAATANTPEG